MSEMSEARLKEYIDINPSVKLQKGEMYSSVEMDKIIVGQKTAVVNNKAEYTGKSCSKFLPNDTLMARITPCLENGKIAKYESDSAGFGSTEFFVLRAKNNKTIADYVYYLSQTKYIRQLAVNSMTGASGRQRADANFIKKIKWNFPDISVQKRIVKILAAYDDLIENNNKRIKLLERMAENLYKEWFVRFRFPGYEDVEFVDGMPKNWVKDKIRTYYETTSGGTPKRSNSDYFESGNIPWLKTGELNDCIILDTDEHVTELGLNKSSAKWLPKNSIAMAMYAGNNVGKLGYLDTEMTCSQACCILYDKRKFSSKHYLFHYLLSIREYLQNISFGAAQQNISQDLINKVNIIMPNDEVVRLFEEKINDIYYNETKILLKQNKVLIQQRDLLLPHLMSGKLEV